MMLNFTSDFSIGKKFESTEGLGFTTRIIKAEPMFFNASPEFAHENGGPITRLFLEALNSPPKIFDSRVHMLMKGWYPAIPGWHHDDVPRGSDGQPDYNAPAYHSRHAMGLVNGDVAPTEFLVGNTSLPQIHPSLGPVYKNWNDLVNRTLAREHVPVEEDVDWKVVPAPSNHVLYFDWQAMHRAVAAKTNGWRWFGRASWDTDRKPTNEIRSQVQVYLSALEEGW